MQSSGYKLLQSDPTSGSEDGGTRHEQRARGVVVEC
jgi:hypothetical protein